MNVPKEKEENLLLYATYTILYLNDTAYNCVKELEPYIEDKDKETKKIFGALKKRVDKYFHNLNTIAKDSIAYLADYCAEMDDICYDSMLAFKNSLYDVYTECNLDDSEYFTQVETMRSMAEVSFVASKKIVNALKRKVRKTDCLNNYISDEFSKIANNFADWAYRKAPKDLNINFNEDTEVMKNFQEMSGLMVDYNSFSEAYKKATEYENERKK